MTRKNISLALLYAATFLAIQFLAQLLVTMTYMVITRQAVETMPPVCNIAIMVLFRIPSSLHGKVHNAIIFVFSTNSASQNAVSVIDQCFSEIVRDFCLWLIGRTMSISYNCYYLFHIFVLLFVKYNFSFR